MYKKEHFGTTSDRNQVEQYTLINKNGVTASFLNLGAVWTSMRVPDKNGTLEDVILGYDTVDAVLKNEGHLGEIIGRNANRIANARFVLKGTVYKLQANHGSNNLHSGPDFYRNRIWNAVISEEDQETALSFSLESPDGDQGYPGHAKIMVRYTLTEANEIKIKYHMICDQDTIANFTNHAYFNLAGHKEKDAMNQMVWIDADYFTPVNKNLVPTGETLSVKGTPMDFTRMKPIKRDIGVEDEQLRFGNGYDHNWVLNHKRKNLALSAKAYDEKSRRGLEVYTDLPGLQFYTANYLSSEFPAKEGMSYGPRQAYCFETQYFPDAVNISGFPSPILEAGKEYRTTTIYKFVLY